MADRKLTKADFKGWNGWKEFCERPDEEHASPKEVREIQNQKLELILKLIVANAQAKGAEKSEELLANVLPYLPDGDNCENADTYEQSFNSEMLDAIGMIVTGKEVESIDAMMNQFNVK